MQHKVRFLFIVTIILLDSYLQLLVWSKVILDTNKAQKYKLISHAK